MILLNKTTRPTKMRVFVIFLVSVLLQVSCTDSDIVTEAKTDMNENYWPQKNNVSFPFEVEDVSQSYSVFYTMRYNQDYPYYNIWVNRLLFDANGNMLWSKTISAGYLPVSFGLAVADTTIKVLAYTEYNGYNGFNDVLFNRSTLFLLLFSKLYLILFIRYK